MKLMLFLLALSVGLHFYLFDSHLKSYVLQSRPRSPRSRTRPPPGFNYFVLSLTWPNAFCKLPNKTCYPSPPKQNFTVHGLWPNMYKKRSPVWCNETAPLNDTILETYKREILQYWPNLTDACDFQGKKRFWYYEWDKHGSCSSNKFPPESYINKTITLGSTYGRLIEDAFRAAGIEPNGTAYSWEKMTQAMKKVTRDKDGFLTCTNDTLGRLQLSEIRLCFGSDADTLEKCNRTVHPNCTKDLVFASPPRPLDTPILGSSILEVEEADGLCLGDCMHSIYVGIN